MTAPVLTDELQELEDFKQLLDRSMDELLEGIADEEFLERQQVTLSRWSAMVNRSLPPALDDAEVAELRGYLVEILTAMNDGSQPLDVLDAIAVRFEAMRHLI